jgi:serine protease Do
LLLKNAPASAHAQVIDPDGDPYFQTLTLSSGFSDDPRTVDVSAGGAASADGLGSGCSGSVGTRPDVRLHYDAGTTFPLNIYVISQEGDLTLVIRRPDGSYICNDDYEGLDPAVLIDTPAAGQYDIWVGVYGSGTGEGTLYISELDPDFASVADADAGDLDLFAEPRYGTLSLSSGFTDDPRTVNLQAGGSLTVGDLGAGCVGSADAEPHVRIEYEAGTVFPLNLYAISDDDDLTLIVNLPDGTWMCSDDYSDGHPAVLIDTPESGTYDIWVGVFGGGSAAGRLYVSELAPDF